MKRLVRVASVTSLLFVSPLGDTRAAGPYDGQWNGSATAAGGRCKAAVVIMTVGNQTVEGQVRFEIDTRDIHGTVSPDSTLGATIGFSHLTGRFIEDMFEGTFRSFDCTWKMVLKRVK